MRKRIIPSSPLGIFFAVLAAVIGLVSVFLKPAQEPSVEYAHVQVVNVYDGDTLKLYGGDKVRLLGIDTPELHDNPKLFRDAERSGQDAATIKRLGRKAYEFTRNLVEGKAVRLEFDVQRRDKYGRLLAYVYLEDGRSLNEEIIRNGYAYPMTIPPNVRFASRYKDLFEAAVEARCGLWAETRPKGMVSSRRGRRKN